MPTTSYKPQYVYQEKTYFDSWSVRRAIEAAENRRFGSEPVNKEDHEAQTAARVEFWKTFGVTYSEQEIVTPDPDPAVVLKQTKTRKLNELESWFNKMRSSKDTHIVSSLGFGANSNETAIINVDGLLGLVEDPTYAPEGTLTFMDFDNSPQQLDKQQLTTLKNEIAAAGTASYNVKWQYRTQIEAAETKEDVEAIMFTMPVFSFEGGELHNL